MSPAGATTPPPAGLRYWAFISYSHADEAWARWLHRALETYRIPARLVGQAGAAGPIPRRLFPVFRDRDELAGSAELGPELQKALRASRTQVVICSPRAAQSRWVEEEIRFYRSLGPAQRVLALIVDGEPHAADPARECFPVALRASEPIAADVRDGGDGRGNARLKLIAGLLGVGFDDLKQRELQARNRRLAVLSTAACGIAGVTIVLAVQAYQARNDAQRRQQQAEDLIEFMLGDLRDKLEPIGKLDILDAVGVKAMDYFASLQAEDQTDAALAARSKALRQIGHVRLRQGNLAGSLEAFRQALALDGQLVERHPSDTKYIFNVGESQYSAAWGYFNQGDIDQALPWCERYVETSNRLLALEPGNDTWLKQVAEAHSNLGAAVFRKKDLDRAGQYFETARRTQQALVDRHPDNREFMATLATMHGWLCTVAGERLDWPEAEQHARRQAELQLRLTQLDPENAGYRYRLAAANLRLLNSQSNRSSISADEPLLQETLQLTGALTELDPENVEFARVHQAALTELVDALLAQDALARAASAHLDALALSQQIWRRAPDKAEAIDELLFAFARASKIAVLQRDRPRATQLLDQAFALALTPEQKARARPARWLDLHLLGWWLRDAGARTEHAREAAAALERLRASGAPAPELLLRYAALQGDLVEVRRVAESLDGPARKDPFLLQFCRVLGACALPP